MADINPHSPPLPGESEEMAVALRAVQAGRLFAVGDDKGQIVFRQNERLSLLLDFYGLNLQSKCNREKNSDSKLRIPYNTSCPDEHEGSCSNEPLHPSYHRRARKYTAHAGREERNQGDSQRTTTVSFNNKQRDLPESGTQR
jgi:hypothetical protein